MTYILRQDQVDKLRSGKEHGKSISSQLQEAVGMWNDGKIKVAGKSRQVKAENNCHLVRFSVERRISEVCSEKMRLILDGYFEYLKKGFESRDLSREIEELNEQIASLFEQTVNERNRDLLRIAGKGIS